VLRMMTWKVTACPKRMHSSGPANTWKNGRQNGVCACVFYDKRMVELCLLCFCDSYQDRENRATDRGEREREREREREIVNSVNRVIGYSSSVMRCAQSCSWYSLRASPTASKLVSHLTVGHGGRLRRYCTSLGSRNGPYHQPYHRPHLHRHHHSLISPF